MKIVTWNMGRAAGAWDYLLSELEPDYALLQETYSRDAGPGHMLWEAIGENSVKYGKEGTYKWGSGVWSRDHELEEVSLPTHQGWAKAARPVGEELTLISLHVELDKEGRSIPILHRMLSDLTPVLEAAGDQVLIGGDLNADVWFDTQYGTRRHAIAFERIEDLGFWHCNRLIPPVGRRTFRGQSKGPVMDDHLFISKAMAEWVVACEVIADDSAPGDHFPVLLELE